MEQTIALTHSDHNTIAAVSTPPGCGGIAVIRISGPDAFHIIEKCWKGKALTTAAGHTAHLGIITDSNGDTIDQVLATVFRNPRSFTGEDTVEISCHGSQWIQQTIVNRLIECGATSASPGEFTRRAFLNGRLDLTQAEGIADMIAADSRAAARMAVSQMRGDFSSRLETMRQKLIDIASLLELELDFSEEDVEFADRQHLADLTADLLADVNRLAGSYKAGKVFKSGIPVAIAGIPNAGKSTLLNTLLNDEKAIVSDIPGTTRDIIEDTVELGGLLFRLYDTAGLHDTADKIESIGIQRARRKISDAEIILWLIDPTAPLQPQIDEATPFLTPDRTQPSPTAAAPGEALRRPSSPHPATTAAAPGEAPCRPSSSQPDPTAAAPGEALGKAIPQHGRRLFCLITKTDRSDADIEKARDAAISAGIAPNDILQLSASTHRGIDTLENTLITAATRDYNPESELIVTNSRHYEHLLAAADTLRRISDGLTTGLSGDFIAQDLRQVIHHIGLITGSITTDDLLHTIFSRFCIGK